MLKSIHTKFGNQSQSGESAQKEQSYKELQMRIQSKQMRQDLVSKLKKGFLILQARLKT